MHERIDLVELLTGRFTIFFFVGTAENGPFKVAPLRASRFEVFRQLRAELACAVHEDVGGQQQGGPRIIRYGN